MSYPRGRVYPDLTVTLSRKDIDLLIQALGQRRDLKGASLRRRLAEVRNSQSLYEAARARLADQCAKLGLLLAPWQLDIVAQAVVRDAERWQIPTDPYEETNP